jgi:hypothetical protein
MSEGIVTAVISALTIGLLGWLGARLRAILDRRKVYQWLKANTKDEPHESHVDTVTLAKGTRLPEDRVRRACMSEERIYHLMQEPEQWSVWRKDPQSIYEKRGPIII